MQLLNLLSILSLIVLTLTTPIPQVRTARPVPLVRLVSDERKIDCTIRKNRDTCIAFLDIDAYANAKTLACTVYGSQACLRGSAKAAAFESCLHVAQVADGLDGDVAVRAAALIGDSVEGPLQFVMAELTRKCKAEVKGQRDGETWVPP